MNTGTKTSNKAAGGLVVLLAGWLLFSPPIRAEDFACVDVKPGPRLGETIGLEYADGLSGRVVDEAIEHWRRCEGYRWRFPSFVNGGTGSRTVRVRFVDGSSGSAKCGSFSGRTIVIYALASDARGRIRSCGLPARLLAHELGHVLGLSDCPAKPECQYALMSHVGPDPSARPTTTPDECTAVERHWLTPIERGERLAFLPQPVGRAGG